VTTFVLVPGGWHGGWWFEPLARRLRTHGHEAYPVTATGVGERHHLTGPAVNLDTHVQDVLAVLDQERLTDVVLCGHSYGGMVITGVADRAPDRIAALVYCDAYVPEDGESCWELAGDGYRQLFLDGARADGFTVAPPPGLDARATGHPLASFVQAIRVTGAWRRIRRREFLYLSGWSGTPFTAQYHRLSDDPEWITHALPVGHNVMADAPDELTELLLATARSLPSGDDRPDPHPVSSASG
jgi:pimeloyl-ACP methyl ester carboxylesterase